MDRVRGGRQKYKRRGDSGLSLYMKAPDTHPVKANGEYPPIRASSVTNGEYTRVHY